MMIGEKTYINPTVHIHPWSTCPDNPTAEETPPNNFTSPPSSWNNSIPTMDDYNFLLQNEALRALQRYLPSNNFRDVGENDDFDFENENGDLLPLDVYSCDNFRIFEFKVKKCQRSRSHDWTECPFAHPGEKARRRDPRKYHYSGTPCPEFRKGSCIKNDGCEFAHGVFECWLHPARYRTQPCKDGLNCKRRICFFAHTPDQLRVLSPRAGSFDGSPKRLLFDGSFGKPMPMSMHLISSPESGSPPTDSPPMSPLTKPNSLSRSPGSHSINDVMASLRQLQLNKMKPTPSALGFQMSGSGCGSPRLNFTRPGFFSLPTTPTRTVPPLAAAAVTQPGTVEFDIWENGGGSPQPQVVELSMERVESGKNLRAKMFEKLSKENPLHSVDPNPEDAPNPDVGWVSDLLN